MNLAMTFRHNIKYTIHERKKMLNWTSLKLNFSALQKTLTNVKTTIGWEKIFAKHTPDKELVSKINEEKLNKI